MLLYCVLNVCGESRTWNANNCRTSPFTCLAMFVCYNVLKNGRWIISIPSAWLSAYIQCRALARLILSSLLLRTLAPAKATCMLGTNKTSMSTTKCASEGNWSCKLRGFSKINVYHQACKRRGFRERLSLTSASLSASRAWIPRLNYHTGKLNHNCREEKRERERQRERERESH